MKIDIALVSSNLNPTYLDFFPIVHKAWKDIVNVRCILVLIADSIPSHLSSYKDDIILFNDKSVPDVFQSQCCRLLVPGTFKNKNVIISDIDMIPMQSTYFTLQTCEDDEFVIYRDEIKNEYPMCYCLANSTTWNKLFGRYTISDLYTECKKFIKENTGTISNNGWNYDQCKLYNIVSKYEKKVILDDSKFKRLDRMNLKTIDDVLKIKHLIKENKFTDFHMVRNDT